MNLADFGAQKERARKPWAAEESACGRDLSGNLSLEAESRGSSWMRRQRRFANRGGRVQCIGTSPLDE
jgi:hypothetical protein